jgi:hypothetical protein
MALAGDSSSHAHHISLRPQPCGQEVQTHIDSLRVSGARCAHASSPAMESELDTSAAPPPPLIKAHRRPWRCTHRASDRPSSQAADPAKNVITALLASDELRAGLLSDWDTAAGDGFSVGEGGVGVGRSRPTNISGSAHSPPAGPGNNTRHTQCQSEIYLQDDLHCSYLVFSGSSG